MVQTRLRLASLAACSLASLSLSSLLFLCSRSTVFQMDVAFGSAGRNTSSSWLMMYYGKKKTSSLVIRWHSDGTRMALGWQSDGTRGALGGHSDGSPDDTRKEDGTRRHSEGTRLEEEEGVL